MKREDDQQLWELLGRLAEPKLSPFFARNVLRQVRRSARRKPSPMWWRRLTRKITRSLPIWTNYWLQTKTTCGKKILRCSHNRYVVALCFDFWLYSGASAKRGRPWRKPCPAPASVPTSVQKHTRSMVLSLSRRSTIVPPKCRALDANGSSGA